LSSIFSGVIVAVVLLVIVIALSFTSANGTVTASTVQRQPLPKGAVVETGYYTDNLNWIGNKTQLTAGMKNFYQKTGVQPYLYITDNINGSHSPSDADAEAFCESLYHELFKDEAHVLVVFFEYDPSEYFRWYYCGSQAKIVIDAEAGDILMDYIDRYYCDETIPIETAFSRAFDDAGNRIMTVTTSPWIPVLIVAGILVILLLLFAWWKKAKKQKNLEDENTKKILNTPLDSFGNEKDDREKKYDD